MIKKFIKKINKVFKLIMEKVFKIKYRCKTIVTIQEINRLKKIQDANMNLMEKANVHGMGIGYKIKNGKITKDLAICCFVDKKVSENKLKAKDRIPKKINGVLTDVTVEDAAVFCANTTKYRPVVGGCSIGAQGYNTYSGTGTLGCRMVDNATGAGYGLTCRHVLLPPKKNVIQPGNFDGGTYPNDCVGTVVRHSHWEYGRNANNKTDAAIYVYNSTGLSRQIISIGQPLGIQNPSIGLAVRKRGRTTLITTGTITHLHYICIVAGNRFIEQIKTTGMVDNGDSGSILMCTNNRRKVGLIMAKGSNYAVANCMVHVMRELGIH